MQLPSDNSTVRQLSAETNHEGASCPADGKSEVMGRTWSGLTWGTWLPLERKAITCAVPTEPGAYRIRHADGRSIRLVYIGQTGRSLCERVSALANGVNGFECPYNDPHTA